jgi:hypothetical protein
MKKRAALLAVVCSSSAAMAKETETSVQASHAPREIDVFVAGLLGFDAGWNSYGFLIGGDARATVAPGLEASWGMSFERLHASTGPVTMGSLLELTLSSGDSTSRFFGLSVGPVFAQGKARAGARMFAGVELFHRGPVPIQVAAELIAKLCSDDPTNQCPPGEQQTWFSGRLGFRF